MQAKPAPPSAGPRPIAAGRARAAASPSVTSRNLATPQPSLRSRRRARSQNKMAAAGVRGGGGASRTSSVHSLGRAGPPSAAPADRKGALAALGEAGSRRPRPEEHQRVAGRSAPVPPTNALPRAPSLPPCGPLKHHQEGVVPQRPPQSTALSRRRPPHRAKPRPLATRAAMKKPRSEKPCPPREPLTYRTGSLAAGTRGGP